MRAQRNAVKAVARDLFAIYSGFRLKTGRDAVSGGGNAALINTKSALQAICVVNQPQDYAIINQPTATGGYGFNNSYTRTFTQCRAETQIVNTCNIPLNMCLYYCVPRRNATVADASDLGTINVTGFDDIDAFTGNAFEFDVAYNPFDNPKFCEYFKISKCAYHMLLPGRVKTVTLSSKWRHYRPNVDKITDLCWRGQAFIACQIWGTPTYSVASQGNQQIGFGAGDIAVTTIRRYQTRFISDAQSLIRKNPGYTQPNIGFLYNALGTTNTQVMQQPAVVTQNATGY